MQKQSFLLRNKVFIIGLFIASLTSIYELFSTGGDPSPWILGWSVVITIMTYFANNLRGQTASIISTVLASAILFFQAHNSPANLNMKEITTTVLLPLLIQILALFNTSPPKTVEYEQSPTIVEAKKEAEELKEFKSDNNKP